MSEDKPVEATQEEKDARTRRAAERIQTDHHGSPNPVMADPTVANERDRQAANAARSAAAGGEEPKSGMSAKEMDETTMRIRAELAQDRNHPLRGLGTAPIGGFAAKENAKKAQDGQSQGEGRS